MRTTKLSWLAGMVFMWASMTDAMAQQQRGAGGGGRGGRGGPRLDPAKAPSAYKSAGSAGGKEVNKAIRKWQKRLADK